MVDEITAISSSRVFKRETSQFEWKGEPRDSPRSLWFLFESFPVTSPGCQARHCSTRNEVSRYELCYLCGKSSSTSRSSGCLMLKQILCLQNYFLSTEPQGVKSPWNGTHAFLNFFSSNLHIPLVMFACRFSPCGAANLSNTGAVATLVKNLGSQLLPSASSFFRIFRCAISIIDLASLVPCMSPARRAFTTPDHARRDSHGSCRWRGATVTGVGSLLCVS